MSAAKAMNPDEVIPVPILIEDASKEPGAAAERDRQFAAMAKLLEIDPQSWAAIRGMMAILALPKWHTGKRPTVEICVAPGVWHVVDAVSVSDQEIVLSHGKNGHRAEYVFPIAAGAPPWRPVFTPPAVTLPGDDGRR